MVAAPEPRVIVIFGVTGAGMTSVANMLMCNFDGKAQSTGKITRYPRQDSKWMVIDTPGLFRLGGSFELEHVKDLLKRERDRLSSVFLCATFADARKDIPALYSVFENVPSDTRKILVVTNLENEEPEMESWWNDNKANFEVHFCDHACITAARGGDDSDDDLEKDFQKSVQVLRELAFGKDDTKKPIPFLSPTTEDTVFLAKEVTKKPQKGIKRIMNLKVMFSRG